MDKEITIAFGNQISLTKSRKCNKEIFVKISPAFRQKQLKELKGAALSVFLCYALHADEYGYTWVSDRQVKEETGYSHTTEARQKLIQLKYLYQGKLKNHCGQFSGLIYRIFQKIEPDRKFVIGSQELFVSADYTKTVESAPSIRKVYSRPYNVLNSEEKPEGKDICPKTEEKPEDRDFKEKEKTKQKRKRKDFAANASLNNTETTKTPNPHLATPKNQSQLLTEHGKYVLHRASEFCQRDDKYFQNTIKKYILTLGSGIVDMCIGDCRDARPRNKAKYLIYLLETEHKARLEDLTINTNQKRLSHLSAGFSQSRDEDET